jgi:hypothetical protein
MYITFTLDNYISNKNIPSGDLLKIFKQNIEGQDVPNLQQLIGDLGKCICCNKQAKI